MVAFCGTGDAAGAGARGFGLNGPPSRGSIPLSSPFPVGGARCAHLSEGYFEIDQRHARIVS